MAITPQDVAVILTAAAVYDYRNAGEADVVAWHKAIEMSGIGHAELGDFLDAVTGHYAKSRDRMMPADLIDGVKAIRARRVDDAVKDMIPPRECDDPANWRAYNAWLRGVTAEAAKRQDAPRALNG